MLFALAYAFGPVQCSNFQNSVSKFDIYRGKNHGVQEVRSGPMCATGYSHL
jgi:hypothetical protein